MSDQQDRVPAAKAAAVVEGFVREERRKQVERKGYTAADDERLGPRDWVVIIAHELGCAAAAALNGDDVGNAFVKVAAVAHAALEAELLRMGER